jgi:two-component system response regulator LytT
MGWTVLIVDDEAPAREELAYLLGAIEDIELIEQAETGAEAVRKAKAVEPDLIFLDIELQDMSGLQVAEWIADLGLKSKIIFATAYDRYAIDAFKVRAFHYILKPYDEKDLRLVLKEIEGTNKRNAEHVHTVSPIKLAIETKERIKYYAPKEIVFISKEGKNCDIHTREHIYETHYIMQDLEKKLGPFGFFRCHKSFLINLEHVLEMTSWLHGAHNLHMADMQRSIVPVSRNYVKDLRLKLEI